MTLGMGIVLVSMTLISPLLFVLSCFGFLPQITSGISNDAVCPFVSVRNRRTFLRENATVVPPHPAMGFGVCGGDPRGMSIFLRSFSPMITSEEPVSR